MNGTLILLGVIALMILLAVFITGWTRNKDEHCRIEERKGSKFTLDTFIFILWPIALLLLVIYGCGDYVLTFLETEIGVAAIAQVILFLVWILIYTASIFLVELVFLAGLHVGEFCMKQVIAKRKKQCANDLNRVLNCTRGCATCNCPLCDSGVIKQKIRFANKEDYERLKRSKNPREFYAFYCYLQVENTATGEVGYAIRATGKNGKKIFLPLENKVFEANDIQHLENQGTQ
ncbi:MAG: hypothetical protein Q4B29_01340 [Candidatus Saccharibacteria bacterium]|nr:hypothetical protein [Candidatus Saccharibacteria bacterium]